MMPPKIPFPKREFLPSDDHDEPHMLPWIEPLDADRSGFTKPVPLEPIPQDLPFNRITFAIACVAVAAAALLSAMIGWGFAK